MPPNRPMVLLIRDERTADRAVLTGIGVVLGRGARQFISPNDVTGHLLQLDVRTELHPA